MITRPRVAMALAQRFDYRLTLLVAPAGFGKTTALAQAVRSNALDLTGHDIWLGASEADNDPLSLLAGLLESCGLEGSSSVEADITSLTDHVWSLAPRRVSLIVDDAHYLTDTCSATLELLIASLPTNGHLLLSGRSVPTLAVADLQVRHDVLHLSQADLSLNDTEAEALIVARGRGDLATLSRHPASADLGLVAGPEATAAYLWQEILSDLEPTRLHALAALSLLPELDDALAEAHSDGRYTAEALTAGLPLIESHDDDSKRMHALLCQPLEATLDDESRSAALAVSGTVELGRQRYDRAVGLFVAAGRNDLAERGAREFASLPTLRTRLDSIRSIRKSVGRFAPESALYQHLDAQARLNLDSAERVARFVSAADHAHREGDTDIEALAVFRAIQAANDHEQPLPPDLVARLEDLAPTVPYAAGVLAYIRSLVMQADGDGRGALNALRGMEVLDDQALLIMKAERFCDLGHPEDVFADLNPGDLHDLPPGAEIFVAFAMWLRGDASPDDALTIGAAMVPGILSRGVLQPSVSILSVVTHIALAAGAMEAAERYASEVVDLASPQVDVRIRLFAAMAQASVLSANGDDAAAAAAIDPELTRVPFGNWPARPLMIGLPLVYLARPDARAMLERCDFGPVFTTALAAGQALASLREQGSAKLALGLPWNEEWVLRAHVLPHHLVELAGAAASEGSPAAEALLGKLPGTRVGLEQLKESGPPRAARWAGQRLSAMPPDVPYPLRINALGSLELVRNNADVRDNDWVRRARVRELLGVVVEERSLGRESAAAALWPSLSTAKASSNLRVTLSHLQGVLQPDRLSDTPPSFLQVDRSELLLSPEVEIDVDEFDGLLERAHATDRAGAPAEAAGLFREALALYRGPYMADVGGHWASITRLRLDSAARTAMTRLGSLELARGEPERALRWATEALKANDIDERAGCLFMNAIAATGDRAGAAEAGARLITALRAAGLEPDPATRRFLDEYGISS